VVAVDDGSARSARKDDAIRPVFRPGSQRTRWLHRHAAQQNARQRPLSSIGLKKNGRLAAVRFERSGPKAG